MRKTDLELLLEQIVEEAQNALSLDYHNASDGAEVEFALEVIMESLELIGDHLKNAERQLNKERNPYLRSVLKASKA